jgi:hypothetical protein
MEFEEIKGKRALSPPGTLAVKLPPELWQPYRRLYQHYQSYLTGLPMLAERDFDGKRSVKLTPKQLEALNQAFVKLAEDDEQPPRSAFEAQERAKSRLFKRLQYLS